MTVSIIRHKKSLSRNNAVAQTRQGVSDSERQGEEDEATLSDLRYTALGGPPS